MTNPINIRNVHKIAVNQLVFIIKLYFLTFDITLGVSHLIGLRLYPLNLIQLVLSKGKVIGLFDGAIPKE